MNPLAVFASALTFVAGIGLIERRMLVKARQAVPLRIHVNGTRGKSTVTRLIHAALVEGGIPSLGKTTGTAARHLLPDGSEKPVRRLSRPSIREQISTLGLAEKLKARALVAECMAIKPELQWVSENKILQSSIGVITNARIDHVEEMGTSLEEIAASLGNTMPRQGLLFTADPLVAKILEPRAREQGTRIQLIHALDRCNLDCESGRDSSAGEGPGWWLADAGLALAVAEHCGVDRASALRGIFNARPDPGAARFVDVWNGLQALDASAANDPESLLELVDTMIGGEAELLFVYNNRQDRLPRLISFLSAELPGGILITGANPGLLLSRTRRKRKSHSASDTALSSRLNDDPRYVPSSKLALELQKMLKAKSEDSGTTLRLVLCGNTKGWPMDLYGSV